MMDAKRLVYVLVELFTRLGYTLSLEKCSLVPSTCKKYLGFSIDSARQAYIFPEDKKQKFIQLRESILARSEVDLNTLQRFCGKCISMCLAVQGCKLVCREVNAAISKCQRNSKNIAVSDS